MPVMGVNQTKVVDEICEPLSPLRERVEPCYNVHGFCVDWLH